MYAGKEFDYEEKKVLEARGSGVVRRPFAGAFDARGTGDRTAIQGVCGI
jgi:hypothetical protein